jgi:hypothetical protein
MEQKYQPVHFYPTDSSVFTQQGLDELKEAGVFEVYGFKGVSMKMRTEACANILKSLLDNSDHGKKLSIDEHLASELKSILGAACYLLNSTSFREGTYFDFDKDEINRKLRRKKC